MIGIHGPKRTKLSGRHFTNIWFQSTFRHTRSSRGGQISWRKFGSNSTRKSRWNKTKTWIRCHHRKTHLKQVKFSTSSEDRMIFTSHVRSKRSREAVWGTFKGVILSVSLVIRPVIELGRHLDGLILVIMTYNFIFFIYNMMCDIC